MASESDSVSITLSGPTLARWREFAKMTGQTLHASLDDALEWGIWVRQNNLLGGELVLRDSEGNQKKVRKF